MRKCIKPLFYGGKSLPFFPQKVLIFSNDSLFVSQRVKTISFTPK